MSMTGKYAAAGAALIACGFMSVSPAYASAFEWETEGLAEIEFRHFSASDNPRGLDRFRWSPSGELTIDGYGDRDNPHIRITGFGRYDPYDDERTHFDLRAAFIEYLWESGDFVGDIKVGLDKEFWGVLESAHLVDIINQTDFIEAVDGEDKLGQPMVRLGVQHDLGTLRVFIMPGFRERTFPGAEGRPHAGIVLDTDRPLYESGREDRHVDYAIRYSAVIGDWDLGLAHFDGTARTPQVRVSFSPLTGLRAQPFYAQLQQTSLDLQATKGDWLLKLEALTKKESGQRHEQVGVGFEYTLYGIFDSATDLGIVGEYLWDERTKPADNALDNDLFTGFRFAFNDVQSTSVLLGAISDLDGDATALAVEAETRLGAAGRITLEYRNTARVGPNDPLAPFADDDFLEVRLARFF